MVTINKLAEYAIKCSQKKIQIKNIDGKEFLDKYGFKLKFLKSFIKASAGDIWPPVPPHAKPTLKNLLFITIACLSSSKCQNNPH